MSSFSLVVVFPLKTCFKCCSCPALSFLLVCLKRIETGEIVPSEGGEALALCYDPEYLATDILLYFVYWQWPLTIPPPPRPLYQSASGLAHPFSRLPRTHLRCDHSPGRLKSSALFCAPKSSAEKPCARPRPPFRGCRYIHILPPLCLDVT